MGGAKVADSTGYGEVGFTLKIDGAVVVAHDVTPNSVDISLSRRVITSDREHFHCCAMRWRPSQVKSVRVMCLRSRCVDGSVLGLGIGALVVGRLVPGPLGVGPGMGAPTGAGDYTHP